ncbi:MAG TPA: hypothetical protein VGM72_12210, partial [Micropepsaceae bacterium]
FGMLPLFEYGKTVVLAGNDAGLRQIPVLAADAGTITYTNVAKLDDTIRPCAQGRPARTRRRL